MIWVGCRLVYHVNILWRNRTAQSREFRLVLLPFFVILLPCITYCYHILREIINGNWKERLKIHITNCKANSTKCCFWGQDVKWSDLRSSHWQQTIVLFTEKSWVVLAYYLSKNKSSRVKRYNEQSSPWIHVHKLACFPDYADSYVVS